MIPRSSIVLLTSFRSHYNDPDVDDNEEGSSFRIKGQTDRRMDGWTDGWMDG